MSMKFDPSRIAEFIRRKRQERELSAVRDWAKNINSPVLKRLFSLQLNGLRSAL